MNTLTKDELKELWQMVWTFRAEVQDAFPTPHQDDRLPFAYTEIGEALLAIKLAEAPDWAFIKGSRAVDAELLLNTSYQRNNPKEHTVERELAQCAMMLLTAVPPVTWNGWEHLDYYGFVAPWTVRNIAIRVGHCLEVPTDYEYHLRTVQAIATHIDLNKELAAELNRMRAKYLPTYAQKQETLVLADYTEGMAA